MGGNQVQSISQPVGSTNANITYTYDADGRVIQRAIDGSQENYGYTDAELTSVSNPLGGFGYSYDTAARLKQVTYPNSQQANFDYFTSSDPLGASGSLKDITNLNPSSAILSKFSYTYNPAGDIKTWNQQLGSNTNTYAMGYDPDSELAAVTQTAGTTGFDGLTANHAVSYTYDASGNRTNETAPAYAHTFGTNNLNQLTGIAANPMTVAGGTSGAATVTVNGAAVTEDANNNFQTSLTPAGGSTTGVTIQSNWSDGTAKLSKYSAPNTQPFIYDANGNLIKDDQKTYTWDAANRLIQINWINPNQAATIVTNITFQYDGLGRRTAITESHGSTVLVDKRFVWCGQDLCQERDSTGSKVNKQFFDQGERIGTTNYFYTFDHLGSVREMTLGDGTLEAEYSYDPWGRQTKLSGDVDADFGYAGFYQEKAAGLDLTWFRAYDPEKGRWLSRDPLENFIGVNYYLDNGDANLYQFVKNNSIRLVDPFGLYWIYQPDLGSLEWFDNKTGQGKACWHGISGSPKYKPLPKGPYKMSNPRRRTNPGMIDASGNGWSVNLNPQFPTKRTYLRLHPSKTGKTAGCLGATADNTEPLFEELEDSIGSGDNDLYVQ